MNKHNQIRILSLIILFCCPYTLYGQQLAVDTLKSIQLREVIVTATQRNAPGTSSTIGQNAIRHIQATDLSDLSQLLPGVLTRNPNLNAPTTFTIRSATYEDATNALGTAIRIDGVQLNNNTNLQLTGLGYGGTLFSSSALSGADLRSLSPASIESIEVIRGIPSARYGDVTSGVVHVNSKASIQPFSASLRFTATEKLAAFSKGLGFSKNRGTLFLGADYAFSARDSRIPEQAFHRIGVQAAYSKNFPSATFRANLRGYWTQDNEQQGANALQGEFIRSRSQGLTFSANGLWKLNRLWITSIDYHAGLTYSYQRNEASTYYSGIQKVTTYTQQSGEQEGIFLSPSYFSHLSVDGKPLSSEASLVANLQRNLSNKVYNHLLLGVEASIEGNFGKGIQFDPLRPPLEMLNLRARSFRDIPLVQQYAAFAEDRMTLRTGRMRTEIQAGIRIAHPRTQAMSTTYAIDPRINIRQVFIERNTDILFNHLSLRAGWGLLHKMPVLAYLYPDKSYTDKNSFTYNDAENGHRLTVMHTFVTDHTANPELKLPANRKFELGIHFRIGTISTDVVWFNEHLRNGYNSALQAEPFTYRRYEPLISKGEQPALTPNGVINKGTPIAFTPSKTFATYLRPQNGIEQKKQGVEYTIDLGQFTPIHSSILVSGGYLKVSQKNTALSAYHPQVQVNGSPYPYVGIYESNDLTSNLRVWQQFNTRFQLITQLPRLGLITSLTLQAVWIDKQRQGMESKYNHSESLLPVYYLDSEGNQHPFTQEMATDEQFAELIMKARTPATYQTDSFGPYFLLNLRVNKKIGRYVSVAFCANNLTASNPKRYTRSTGQYTILNPDLYYGAEINIQF